MGHRRKIPVLTIAALITCAIPARAVISQPVISQPVISQAPTFSVPTAVPQGTQVRISSGSDTMETLSKALEQGFEAAYAGSRVDVEAKTTDQAIQDVINDNADFAAISRPLTAAEEEKGLEAIALARPKIAVVVDQSNPFAQSLTGNQFAQIFRGEVTDWAEVGGASRPLKLVDRPADNEVRQSLQPYPVFTAAPFEAAADALTLQPDTTKALAAALGPDGIGYVLVDELDSEPTLKALQLHQTLPTDTRYPFSQPYSLVYARGAASPAVSAFLGYVTGQPGQTIVDSTNPSDPDSSPDSSAVAASPTSAAAGTAKDGDTTTVSPAAANQDDASSDLSSSEFSPATEGIGTLNADGQLVDADGNLISPAGFLINADGNLIDTDGNLLADGAAGVLGIGVNPDAVGSGSNIEIEAEQGPPDNPEARGRWWWLLLPLAGLALLVWAAGKTGREEEIGYSTDAEAGRTSGPDDRIVSAFDSSSQASVPSEVGDINAGAQESTSKLDTPSNTDVKIPRASQPTSVSIATSVSTIDGSATDRGADEPLAEDRITNITTTPVANSAAASASASATSEDTENEDWLVRAKQRINEATDQMKQTAAEMKDDATGKRL